MIINRLPHGPGACRGASGRRAPGACRGAPTRGRAGRSEDENVLASDVTHDTGFYLCVAEVSNVSSHRFSVQYAANLLNHLGVVSRRNNNFTVHAHVVDCLGL